ncbi:mechanosensitive ion channel family protein [Aeribacillus pallidus]|uniref:mechanosensitive ion channel family protein n=1 Tax=Aeribacillus pallidus TaxID=33936 RepID=UPI003D1E542D
MFDISFIQQVDWSKWLINIAIIILKFIGILIVYFIVNKVGQSFITKMFERYKSRNHITEGRATTLEGLSLNIFSYVLIFVLFITTLQIIGIEVMPILAGAGIIGLAVAFGAQGLVSDVVTGFFILLENQIEVGDYITTGSFSGIVEQVGLRTTKIRGFDGTLHYVPNREITSVSNHSRGTMRALVDIGISYDDNIDEAITVLQNACDRLAKEDKTIVEGPNVLGVQSLGSSDVVIRVIAKTENMQQWAVERKLRKLLKETLVEHGIEIPYPHQVYIEKSSS